MSNVTFARTVSAATNHGWTLVKAATSASAAGLAFGLWQNNTPGTSWLLVGAGGAALLSARWLWQMARPKLGGARIVLPALPALPVFRRLALPAPHWATKQRASAAPKPAVAEKPRVDDDRVRLKAAGFSDAEISQLLVARATGGDGARSGFGTGTATGLLNNVDAVLTHARSLLPSFRLNLQRVFDAQADKATRISAAFTVAFLMGATGGFGYFVYLEAIEFRARAITAWSQACIERQKNAINHTSFDDLVSGKKLDGDDECSSR